MPTYAYACTECDHRFDAVQAFSDASLTDCPQCTGRLRKLFSAVGIVFKGSGFYRTDSRSQSNGSKSKSSSESSSSKEPAAATSSSTSSGANSSSSTTTPTTSSSGSSSTP